MSNSSVRPPLTVGVRLAYGVGQLAEGLKNGALSTFLLFYYSQVAGLSPTLAGLAIGISLAFDAVIDPVIGSVSDHWRSRWGRRHPFIFVALVPTTVAFIMLFSPSVTGDAALFAWLLFWVIVIRLAMSLYLIPYLALGAELSTEFSERVSLVGFRMFFSIAGGAAASTIGFQFFFTPTAEFSAGQLNPDAYLPFATALVIIMCGALVSCGLGTRAFIPFLAKPQDKVDFHPLLIVRRTLLDVGEALRHAPFAWLFSGVMLVYIMIGTNAALDLYLGTYFWEYSSKQLVALSFAYPAGSVIGLLLSPAFQRRFGKRAGLLFGTVTWGVLQVLPVVLRLLDWFPGNESDLLAPLVALVRIVQGACGVQANTAFGSAIAEVADVGELQTGRRQEGIYFASNSFSHQIASGFGSVVAGLALDFIAWPSSSDIQSSADIPADTIFNLGLVYGPLTVGFSALTYWCYAHYRMSREDHAEVLRLLDQRRAAQGIDPGLVEGGSSP